MTAEAVAETPELPEVEIEKPSSQDLSVKLEFEEDLKPAANVSMKPSLSEDLDKVIETVSLSLDASAPKRPPLNQSDDSLVSSDSDDVESFFSSQDISSADSIVSETPKKPEIELPIVPEPDASQAQGREAPKVHSEGSVEYSVDPKKPALEVSPRKEPKPRQSRSGENNWEDPVSKISQRTAKGRQSAKSVFAAKNINSKNKKAYLYGGAGVMAVVLLAGGYFLLSMGSSNNSFSIPQGDFVSSSEADFSGDNSGNIERVNTDFGDTQIGQAVGANVAPTDLASLGDDFSPQVSAMDSNDGQIAQANQGNLAGLNITSNLASTSAPVTAEPMSLPVSSVEETESQTANSAASISAPSNPTSNIELSQPTVSVAEVESPREIVIDDPVDSEIDLISFRRKETINAVSPLLSSAYTAYQAGNFDSALALYNRVLANEPQNIDSLLGKAAISNAQGDNAQAMALYSTVLALNPMQAIARSGLLSLLPTVNPADQERQLRRLVSEYPSVAPLAFALGNFYASQSRWVDAQKNYFNALSLAKADNAQGTQISPDYAFNLAISLDRLNQAGPAVTYYHEALILAAQYPANFDLEIARVRISKLSGTSTP